MKFISAGLEYLTIIVGDWENTECLFKWHSYGPSKNKECHNDRWLGS
jgi:hypothetical protein